MAMTNDELAEFFHDLEKWHDTRINQIDTVINHEGNVVLQSGGDESKRTTLNDEQSRAFRAGMRLAKHIMGEFPVRADIIDSDDEE